MLIFAFIWHHKVNKFEIVSINVPDLYRVKQYITKCEEIAMKVVEGKYMIIGGAKLGMS